jgi:hypothetical protein
MAAPRAGPRYRLFDRSTTDILILMIAMTICFAVLAAGAAIAAIEFKDPGTDTSQAQGTIGDVINTLIGLLAGFLAGRTEAQRVHRERREAEEEMSDGSA